MKSFDPFQLPYTVGFLYRSKGISSFYSWQDECLRQDGVIEGIFYLFIYSFHLKEKKI
jgi:hypothetical protein